MCFEWRQRIMSTRNSQLTTLDSRLTTDGAESFLFSATLTCRCYQHCCGGMRRVSSVKVLVCRGRGGLGCGVGSKRFIKAKRQMATATKKCCKQFAQWRRVLRKSLLPKHKDNNRGCPPPPPALASSFTCQLTSRCAAPAAIIECVHVTDISALINQVANTFACPRLPCCACVCVSVFVCVCEAEQQQGRSRI